MTRYNIKETEQKWQNIWQKTTYQNEKNISFSSQNLPEMRHFFLTDALNRFQTIFPYKLQAPQLACMIETISVKKLNIDPDSLITAYGQHATRLFLLSDTPPNRPLCWSSEQALDGSLLGAWRFIHKLYALLRKDVTVSHTSTPIRETPLLLFINQTNEQVKDDLSKACLNRALARCRKLAKVLSITVITKENDRAIYHYGLESLIKLLYPIAPHITEELWQQLGHKKSLSQKID